MLRCGNLKNEGGKFRLLSGNIIPLIYPDFHASQITFHAIHQSTLNDDVMLRRHPIHSSTIQHIIYPSSLSPKTIMRFCDCMLVLLCFYTNQVACFSVPQSTKISATQNRISKRQRPLNAESEKRKGVYVRPSGAIERGSGFFFPGLEGPRVRFVVGSVLLVLTGVNQITTPHNGLSFEEIVAILFTLLLLFQAVIEFGKEELIVEGNSAVSFASTTRSKAENSEELLQQWTTAVTLDDDYKSKVQWAAASYLSVTPASQIMLLHGGKSDDGNTMVYRLGDDATTTTTNSDEESGIQAAFAQLRQSKGGRISLPLTHPAAVALGLSDTRCVVLQRITEDSCWMITSDQLLASFTASDLKWLGQMAAYIRDT